MNSNQRKLPSITTIICHKDYQQYLSDAIKSSKNQIYPSNRLRTCVIDGGSNDFESVLKICKDDLFINNTCNTHVVDNNCTIFSDGFNTLLHFKRTNGPSFARNRGIELYFKDTDYFAILDADDIMKENKVKEMIEELLLCPNIPSVGAIYGDTIIVNTETGKETREFREPYSINRLQQECIVHSGCLISKLAFQEVGLYDESLRVAEDYDLWLRIAKKFAIVHIPQPLTIVRVQPMNSTATIPKETWNDCLARIRQKHA